MANSVNGASTAGACADAWGSFPYAAAGKDPQTVKSYSHFNDDLASAAGELHGESRRWGDAPVEVQRGAAEMILRESGDRGLTLEDQATILATVAIESGFNPDAAAGTTSASGLAQMVDATGAGYGLDAGNRFSAAAQVTALMDFFDFNKKLAAKKEKDGLSNENDELIYALHHDGPTLQYGGQEIAHEKFLPWREKFMDWLSRGLPECE